MLLSLAPVSLASSSQSWTEDRHTQEEERGRWRGEGSVHLFFSSSHQHLIGFFFLPLSPVDVVLFCGVEGRAQKPLTSYLIEVFCFVLDLPWGHYGLL